MSDPQPIPDSIMVQAYSPRFEAAVTRLLRVEGGFVNDPSDHGGATNYGVSLRFLVAQGTIDPADFGGGAFDLDMDGDLDAGDIAKLTTGDAKFIYDKCFWGPMRIESYPLGLGEALFDEGVNGGITGASKLLQRAINRCLGEWSNSAGCPAQLPEDGQIGPATLAAMRWVQAFKLGGTPALVGAYRVVAELRYRAIAQHDPSQQRFLEGWLNRADNLGNLS